MEASKSVVRNRLIAGRHERSHKDTVIGRMAEEENERRCIGRSSDDHCQLHAALQYVRQNDLPCHRRNMTCRPAVRTLRTNRYRLPRTLCYGVLAVLLSLLITPVKAAFINFQNCLSQSYQDTNPPALQFVPLFMDASFNTTDPSHRLTVTVWGNVTGAYTRVQLPSPNDPAWMNPNFTDGKIENLPPPRTRLTTLSRKVNVLTYEPWKQSDQFCDVLVNGTCPLAPRFTANV